MQLSSCPGVTLDIPQAIAGRIDYLHQMLGLQNNEAVFGEEHPVCKEYPKPGGGAVLEGWQRRKNNHAHSQS